MCERERQRGERRKQKDKMSWIGKALLVNLRVCSRAAIHGNLDLPGYFWAIRAVAR